MIHPSSFWLVPTVLLATVFSSAAGAEPAFEVTEVEDRVRCDHYDPMRQPFFGVTHLHTGLSFDASIRFVDYRAGNNPRGAYRFAQQLDPITLPDPVGIEGLGLLVSRKPMIDRPADWGAVTDHSEHFGEMGICKDFLTSDAPGRFSLECRMINGFYWQTTAFPSNFFQRTLASNAFTQLTMMNDGPSSDMTRMPLCVNNPRECNAAELAVWEEHQNAAEENYDRSRNCSFTTFNAYEVTSTPSGTNWHRNVIFRNDRVVKQPITAIDMGVVTPNPNPTGDGPDGVGIPPNYRTNIVPVDRDVFPVVPGTEVSFPLPERLWNRLERECLEGENITAGKAIRCDVITIPHNSNVGGGQPPFIPPQWFTPFNEADARRRLEFEPLVEIYQNKGSSECRWDPRF